MTVRNLEYVINPKSVAVFGASVREGAVGRVIIENIVNGGYEGQVWPVNPKYPEVCGLKCYKDVADLPSAPDLAVIVTPPAAVPGLISDLGAKGTRAAVVITAGLTRENGLRQAMLDAARPYLFRIVGPNTVGLMLPPLKLNAGFAHMAARPGNIALLSQSGAIATSLIDWAAQNNIGFSHIVSMGDMADVDVGDWLDMLAGDANTRAIIMYLETISDPRKFMSAARAAARVKPVIAVKSGRHEMAAKAAATHTGALSGADRVTDAALRRAGILRVNGLAELFDAAEITSRFDPLPRARVGIVTNGGGAGVLAVDQLADCDGEMAELSPETLKALDAVLPPTWSHSNPVDLIGDASPERYKQAVEAVANDPDVDVILVMNCPTGLASPLEAAAIVGKMTKDGKVNGKPVLTCWLGDYTAREGRKLLREAGVASFDTPADAIIAISYLNNWSRVQQALSQVPQTRSEDVNGDHNVVLNIFRQAAREGRTMLTEPEAKAAIAAYGIPTPLTLVARKPSEVAAAAASLLQTSPRIVIKLLSKAITHKSDVGGVILNIDSAESAEKAAQDIERRVRAQFPDADIEGYTVQPMVARRQAHELIAGMSVDPIFGPVVLFGAGGVSVEVVNDTAIALPPLDDVLADDLISRTRISKLLAGFRDQKPANRKAIATALNGLSQMIVDFPCVTSIDINPLLADADGVIALDARIEINLKQVEEKGPNPALAIRPYPTGWNATIAVDDARYAIRPIKPADIELYPDFLSRVSPDDIRLRFLTSRKVFTDDVLKRLTQIDYDRDIAFVLLEQSGALAGVGRLSCDPDKEKGEFALLVRTDLQGHGLGWALLQHIIAYAQAEKISQINGVMFNDNTRMLMICREFGFKLTPHPNNSALSVATLDL